jgi:ADP-ribosylglycohydrolase
MKPTPQILITSLAGDALCLGPHWIYDQREIEQKLGRITGYAAPLTSYHPGKQAGDFTHYGDQTLILLRSLAEHGRFDLTSLAAEWRAFWEDPTTHSYRDGATKATLENLRKGALPAEAASDSHDIAGAARIAPLFLLKWESDEALLQAARAQTSFTHRDPQVIETAEFFARVTLSVQSGTEISTALRETAALTHWQAIPDGWFAAAVASMTSREPDAVAAYALGLSCHVADAFPVICHLLLRHPEDPVKALTTNAEAGGDSAARALLMGMVYGALPNATPLPGEWITGLRARAEIQHLIARITSLE